MAGQDVWSDFETLRHNLKLYKVEQLKQILTGFNEECYTNMTKSGKKQDLIDKIGREIEDWRRNDMGERWSKGKNIMTRVRQHGIYVPQTNPPAYQSGNAAPHAIPRYDPYAPPRRPNQPAPAVAASPAVPAAQQLPSPAIRFKHSPFFKVDLLVSAVIECPESASSVDRRSQSLSFVVTPDILPKLNSTSPKYQLRLYCTSSTYYTPPGAFRSPLATPCPIEFPPTCEVRVNSTQLGANLKGLKKKPGTAPPPDLGKLVRLSPNASNRVEMIYVNSQQPTPPKKYYLVVMLVEVTTVDQLIERLRKGKYKSKVDVLEQMNKATIDDDDIIAGHQKMSLKCPLSFMRITTPCRASTCVHPQCFDAMSWFSVMEQTTTWMCPVCEKVLNVEDLIIDGYFDSILHDTPEDVEDVIVEADGQWHTDDNKYGSLEWRTSHPTAPARIVKRETSPAKPITHGMNGVGKPRHSNDEIVILDSDDEDEDEGRVKRELSPSTEGALAGASRPNTTSQSRRSQASDVIDLTLDSDDEAPRPSVPPTKKRKDTEDLPSPTEQIWKKSRTDNGPSSSSPSSFTTLVNNSTLRMADDARRLASMPSSSTQPRYPSSQQPSYRGSQSYSSSGSLPSGSPSLPRRAPSSSHDNFRNTLPPLSSYVSQQRGSGAGNSSPQHWR